MAALRPAITSLALEVTPARHYEEERGLTVLLLDECECGAGVDRGPADNSLSSDSRARSATAPVTARRGKAGAAMGYRWVLLEPHVAAGAMADQTATHATRSTAG
jgi:hypothetical protein